MKLDQRYIILVIFVSITLFGIVVRYMGDAKSALWQFWGVVDTASAVALSILAFMGYREYIKSEDEIKIYFNVEGKVEDTGLSLLRKDCTRGEIVGLLEMMQTHTKERFHFDSQGLSILLDEVQKIQKAQKDIFVIPLTQKEFEQFTISKG